jgi:DNA mismatch repair protein MutS
LPARCRRPPFEASEPATHPAIDRLQAIDPDRLTPREALDALYELRALLP